MSHETIYQSLFVQSRGMLRKELHTCLRSGRAVRRSKTYTTGGFGQVNITRRNDLQPAIKGDSSVEFGDRLRRDIRACEGSAFHDCTGTTPAAGTCLPSRDAPGETGYQHQWWLAGRVDDRASAM